MLDQARGLPPRRRSVQVCLLRTVVVVVQGVAAVLLVDGVLANAARANKSARARVAFIGASCNSV